MIWSSAFEAIKWVVILILFSVCIKIGYDYHQLTLDIQKMFDINAQLQQTIEDQARTIETINRIRELSAGSIHDLIIERDELNKRMGKIEKSIDKVETLKKSKPVTPVLKNTVKKLKDMAPE